MIPCYAVINKPVDNDFYTSFAEKYKHIILGEVPLDECILNYDFDSLKQETLTASQKILTNIQSLKKRGGLSELI